ncbi:MAG: Nif3-like dinuclear metal center hexameric protein [Proteobacteria bacterium]|nr:Nif3-like dinuclear metal center hexameric protein [Pseudomonadota bacterium]MBU1715314.1 Nif3-like dinuclear metal center hexameric protein [Pseudomonadota bacterium]
MSSPFQLKDLFEILNEIAATDLAESWDNVGLMVGDPSKEVTGIMVALDPTEEVLDEAIAADCNTVITHHPLIFHPLKSIRTDLPSGRILVKALGANLSVAGWHTNLDVAQGGVNDVLADKVGIVTPLRSLTGADSGGDNIGFGRIGRLSEPVSGKDFLSRLLKIFGVAAIKVAGKVPDKVSTVAVCGGSGSELAETAFSLGADLYITGEVKHSTGRWAEEAGFCVVDAGHFSTENMIVPDLAERLRKSLAKRGEKIKVKVSARQKTPFDLFRGDS